MKTKIEASGYEIEIEEVDGVISVVASKDGETVEEFTLSIEEGDGEPSEELDGFDDFGSEEDDFDGDMEDAEGDLEEAEDDLEEAEEDIEEAEEDVEEAEEDSKKLESFQSFINKRK